MHATQTLRSRLPVLPVLLPAVLLVLAWVAHLPLIMLSEGAIATATCIPLPTATITTVLVVVSLVRFRSGATWAPWLLWAAISLCMVVSAYWLWRFETMMTGAIAAADARSAEVMQRNLGADRLWMWVGALLSLVPVLGGGAGGYFWLRAVRRRLGAEQAALGAR